MIKLGLPSKGRLMENSLKWFAQRGLSIHKDGEAREYKSKVEGFAGIEAVLLSASEIPKELAAGRIDLGVTGTDLVHERIANYAKYIKPVAQMGFGQADLVIAVPACWTDVAKLHDLDAVAARFQAQHGFRLRIATKYHNLVRQFLKAQGIADYQLIDSQGATEGTVKNETAEAIADITSSGNTLRANHLRMLEDGLVLRSQATLWRCTASPLDTLAPFLQHLKL